MWGAKINNKKWSAKSFPNKESIQKGQGLAIMFIVSFKYVFIDVLLKIKNGVNIIP